VLILSSPVVFISGCIESALPVLPDDNLTPEEADAHIEEQRRLFFVGITRVKAELPRGEPGTLILTCARELELRDALGAGTRPARQRGTIAHVHASRFFAELEPEAPKPVAA
jgi:DNA helicase-2/ATP-dependent DNA helicase PcrA